MGGETLRWVLFDSANLNHWIRTVVILYYILIFYPDDGQSSEDNWFSKRGKVQGRNHLHSIPFKLRLYRYFYLDNKEAGCNGVDGSTRLRMEFCEHGTGPSDTVHMGTSWLLQHRIQARSCSVRRTFLLYLSAPMTALQHVQRFAWSYRPEGHSWSKYKQLVRLVSLSFLSTTGLTWTYLQGNFNFRLCTSGNESWSPHKLCHNETT
jgi:hypothetical protein